MRKYTEEEILKLAGSLEKSEMDYDWLKNNNCKELAALRDLLVYDNTSALEWLKRNKQELFVDFYNALLINRDYLSYILKSDFKEWAAVVSVVHLDGKALEWLVANNMKHYAILAKELTPIIQRGLDKRSSLNDI